MQQQSSHSPWSKIAQATTEDVSFSRRKHGVLVLTPAIFNEALSRGFVALSDVQLLVFDEAHHCRKRHAYAQIMSKYRALPREVRPRIFGMTASPVNLKLSPNEGAARRAIMEQVRELENNLDARVVTISDLAEIQRVRAAHDVATGGPTRRR
jgi:endoribonuclease Dicer